MRGGSVEPLDEVLPFLQQLAPGLPAGFVYNTARLMFWAALSLLSLLVARHLFILARERISSRRYLKRLPLKADLASLPDTLAVELWGLVEHCAFLGGIVDTHTVRRGNSKRVSRLVYELCEGEGPVLKALYTAAAMVYDVGFLDVPQPLFHAELFSRKERTLFRTHVSHALYAFGFVSEKWRRVFNEAGYFHHENYDGTGYPEGLAGDQIPRVARAIRLAESFVALTARKAYRKPLSARRAFRELVRSAAQYDPVYLARLERIVYKRHRGAAPAFADMPGGIESIDSIEDIDWTDDTDNTDSTEEIMDEGTSIDSHTHEDTGESTPDEALTASAAEAHEGMDERLLQRFLRYVAVNTQSDSKRADAGVMPSTQGQRKLALMLADELRELGLIDVRVTESCYVYAYLPSNCQSESCLCLLAHLDTSEEAPGEGVHPIVHKGFAGGQIALAGDTVLDTAADTELAKAARAGHTIITSDGNTLLGADDKAGVAAIMTCLDELARCPDIRRVGVEVVFSPDEETGHGMDGLSRELIRSKRAYTVDGGNTGEIELECFNAVKSQVVFTGRASHTGSARGTMVSAVFMAASFIQSLPATERPESTEGREGFFAPIAVEGTIEESTVTLLLRDFTADGIKRRQEMVDLLARAAAASAGGQVSVRHTPQYTNMKEGIDAHPDVVERLVRSYRECGLVPTFPAIRGGTDGAALCQMGIPCPNVFTGGHNFHSKSEWASLEQMTLSSRVLVELCCEEG